MTGESYLITCIYKTGKQTRKSYMCLQDRQTSKQGKSCVSITDGRTDGRKREVMFFYKTNGKKLIFVFHQVREGLKKHSNWPTYPQLYVNGELVGGLDIVRVCVKHVHNTLFYTLFYQRFANMDMRELHHTKIPSEVMVESFAFQHAMKMTIQLVIVGKQTKENRFRV